MVMKQTLPSGVLEHYVSNKEFVKMFAIVYGENYLFLKEYSTRKEATEELEYHLGSLIFKLCHKTEPTKVILANKELGNFIKNNATIQKILQDKNINMDKLLNGECNFIHILSNRMEEFKKIKEYLAKNGSEDAYNPEKIISLVEKGFTNTI